MADRPFYETNRKLTYPETNETSNVVEFKRPEPEACEKCGFEWGSVPIGFTYPFCKGNQADHILDEKFKHYGFEPYVDEHIPGGTDVGTNYVGDKVVGHFIDSRATRNQLMKEHNLHADKSSRREHRNRQIDYDKVAENVARRAFDEWRQR